MIYIILTYYISIGKHISKTDFLKLNFAHILQKYALFHKKYSGLLPSSEIIISKISLNLN